MTITLRFLGWTLLALDLRGCLEATPHPEQYDAQEPPVLILRDAGGRADSDPDPEPEPAPFPFGFTLPEPDDEDDEDDDE